VENKDVFFQPTSTSCATDMPLLYAFIFVYLHTCETKHTRDMNVGLACVNRRSFFVSRESRLPCGFHLSTLRVKQADVFL